MIIEGVYKQTGLADEYIPFATDASGVMLTTVAPISSQTVSRVDVDAGGRSRVSTLTTLFDGKTLGQDETIEWESVGTGLSDYANNKVNLAVTSGQYEIRRSKRYLPYFSSKSQLIELTMDGFGSQAGVEKRAGYFSSSAVAPYNTNYDGFFVLNTGTGIRLQCWRNGVNTLDLPFEQWDYYSDVADYDWNSFTVLMFDYLWLGGTELRLFIKTTVGFTLAHKFEWASTNTDTFIASPNQNVRYEIRGISAAGSLRSICSVVATEGDISSSSKSASFYNPTQITTNTVGTIYALKGVKKLSQFRDTNITLSAAGVANTGTTDQGIIMLIINPTLSAPLTYVTKGKVSEGTATNQTVTAGTGRVISADPAGITGISASLVSNYLASIGMNIDNTSDEYVLCYMPTTSNQTVFGTLSIREQ